jgi:hypothetical protein
MSNGLSRFYRLFLSVIVLGFFCSICLADDVPPDPVAVQTAITKAQNYLFSKQTNGTWETVPKRVPGPALGGGDTTAAQYGGMTALVTYALLDSGIPASDPRLKPAIDFLKTTEDVIGIYALGTRCQVWHLIPQDASVRKCMLRDGTLLVNAIKSKGEGTGFYDYTCDAGPDAPAGYYDHSVSQYGVLGLWACSQSGLELKSSYWQTMDTAWRKAQNADGGWSYHRGAANHAYKDSTIAMTAAGVASLFITADQLNFGNVVCDGNATDPTIERGLAYLGEHFDGFTSDYMPTYSLYGIERIGVASGRKYLGAANWFARGAKFFLSRQGADGSFSLSSIAPAETSFGLLFLVHGRAPVVVNKLDYRPQSEIQAAQNVDSQYAKSAANWNQRPRDAVNLVHWMSRQTEEVLNWQVVTLHQSVDDLLDAPILYVAGNQPLKLTPEEEKNLKEYIEEGGLVLFNADCGGAGFIASVKKLARKLFPTPGEFTTIPPTHPIFTDEQYLRKKWKMQPTVLGLNNGVRELMILIPDNDPAKGWQAGNELVHPEQFQLPDDIFLYAVDEKHLRSKGETYTVRADPAITAKKTIKLARLQYAGPWDPEPGGWRRLAAVMHNTQSTDLLVQTIKLGDAKLDGFKIAHLTGTVKFEFSQSERDALKKFIETGGTLIVDAAGGRGDFAISAETELHKIFPDAKGFDTSLPPSDPVYTEGGKIDAFEYRRFAKKTLPGGFHMPRMRGITIGNRVAVYYSPEDLSGGLVGQSVDGINGYEPPTATAIMSHILQYLSR